MLFFSSTLLFKFIYTPQGEFVLLDSTAKYKIHRTAKLLIYGYLLKYLVSFFNYKVFVKNEPFKTLRVSVLNGLRVFCLFLHVIFNRIARTNKISVSVSIVYASYGWPVFSVCYIVQCKGCFFSSV